MFQERPAQIAPAAASHRHALVPVPSPRTEPAAPAGELWLAAHFPRLPLDALVLGNGQARAAVVTAAASPFRR